MSHIEDTDAGMSLYITSDSNTSGTVSVPGQSWSTTFTVTANNLTVVNVPTSKAYISCSDCIQNKGVRVISTRDVVVFAHHYEGNKSDATLVLPTRTQGKEYYLMSYQESTSNFGQVGKNTFSVVATKDSTKVKITPATSLQTSTGGTFPANDSFIVTLNAGQVYHALAKTASGDLTGTHVEVIDTGATANCRTISVFAGSTYTRVGGCSSGGGINSGDNLMEQMFPVTSWGRRFVFVPALGRANDNFRVLAAEDGTQVIVFKSGGAPDIGYIDAGEYYDVTNVSAIRNVISTKPVSAAQFQKTSKCDGGGNRTGDPSMTILNPLEQTLKDITLFSSNYYDIDNHYINVVIPTWSASTFRIDGNTATFTGVPNNSSYSYTRLQVTSGNHRLTANEGFIATAYGEGRYESYGYAAGANIKDLTAVASVTNSAQINEVSSCIGRPVAFTGEAEYSVVKWEWYFGDGNIDSVQNPSHIYSDTGTYLVKLYTYKPTFDGCSNYDSSLIEVKIYAKPEARLFKGNLCDSTSVIFSDSSFIPAPEEYLFTRWTFNDEAVKFGPSTTKYFDTTGKVQLMMEVITAHQCKDTFLDSLVVNPLPVASFASEDVCFFDSSILNNTTYIKSGAVDSFFWDFGYGSFDNGINAISSYNYLDSGYHTITLNVISDSGCTDQFMDSVYKYPRFDVSFTSNDTCLGFGSILTNTTFIEGGNFTDTVWYTSAPDTSYSYNLTSQFDASGTYTIDLIMEQDSFCKDTFSQNVVIHPLAVPNFSVTETCLNDSTKFEDASTLSNGSYTSSWDLDDGLTGYGNVVKVKYSSGGTKSIKVTTTTDKGCVSDSTRDITITYPEILSLNLVDECTGVKQTVSADTILGLDSFTSYQWLVNGFQLSTNPSFSLISSLDGITTVVLNATTFNGCTLSAIDSFESFTIPTSDFTISPVCHNDNLYPIDNSSVNAPSTLANYNWFYDDVLVSTSATPIIKATSDGISKVKLLLETNRGCKDSLEKNVAIYTLPLTGMSIANKCLGDDTRFTSTASISSGTITSTDWLIDNSNFTGANVDYNFPAVGGYDILQTLMSDNGCISTLNRSVVISPLPVLEIDLASFTGCVPFDIAIENNSTVSSGAITTYNWNWGDGNTSSGDISQYTYITPGTYSISVDVVSDSGCTDTLNLSTQVEVYENPIADFSFTPLEPSNITEFVTFKDSSSSDVTSWDWSTSDGGVYSGKEVYHTFVDSGNYAVSLTVTNDEMCTDEITKIIYVTADLFVHIPTVFTPNGDLINDTYGLGGLTQGVVDLKLEIYNRWGEKIYVSKNPDDKWDGTYKGKPVPQGVYLYMIQFTNPKRSKWHYYNGELNIIR
ncbi:PKD domain-containing protein [Bacteroidia bacterium]|nr:PKD domain-containing protein [Bacteroidia bacterium]